MNNVMRVVRAAIAGEGGTFGPDASEPAGYWVGGIIPGLVYDKTSDVDPNAVAEFAEETLDEGLNVGVWADPDTGMVYVDASEHFTSEARAVSVARQRRELAIWDIANGKEINVTGGEPLSMADFGLNDDDDPALI